MLSTPQTCHNFIQKVLVIGLSEDDAKPLFAHVSVNIFELEFPESDSEGLLAVLEKNRPDILMLNVNEINNVIESQLKAVQEHYPLPVILQFPSESSDNIMRFLACGVSVLLSGEVNPSRMPSILDTAIARHQITKEKEQYTQKLEQQLQERKIIAKAKGLLMQSNGITENEAYEFLRKTSMQKNQSMAELSKKIIDSLS